MNALSSIAALLISVLLLIAGNALIGVLTPLRASLIGFPDLTIGLFGSVYFAGMLAGTLATPAIVRRVGHIRAFSVFVAVAIVAVILMPGWERPAAWMLCRGALGFVFAGIYAVIESWINAKADNASRGALYGVYQIVTFAASAGGQLLLREFAPDSFLPFSVGGALLALANRAADDDQRRPARRAEVGPPAAAAGWSAWRPFRRSRRSSPGAPTAPVRARAGLRVRIGVDAVGGAAVHRGDRRRLGARRLSRPACSPIGWTGALVDGRDDDRQRGGRGRAAPLRFAGAPLIVMGFLVGLTTYTLYTLAVSHANDRAKPHDMVAGLGRAAVHLLRRRDPRAVARVAADAPVRPGGAVRPERRSST